MSRNGLFVEYCAKDFLDGTTQLSPMEELAYRRIVDMIYATNNNLLNDDQSLAWSTKTGEAWPQIKIRLLDLGKIFSDGQRLFNDRCNTVLAKTAKKIAQKSGAGKASAEARKAKSLNKNDTGSTAVETSVPTDEQREPQRIHLTNEPHIPILPSEVTPPPKPVLIEPRPELDDAIRRWNVMAGEVGLPTVQKLTNPRKVSLAHRLRECGGIEGWDAVLSKIRGSPFLLGDNQRGWRANFDFLMQASSFTKLMEGAYDAKQSTHSNGTTGRTEESDRAAMFGAVGLDAAGHEMAGDQRFGGETIEGDYRLGD